MLSKLHTRLAAVLFGLLLLLGALYVASTLATTKLYLDEVNQKLNLDLARHMVAEKLVLRSGEVHEEGLDELFHMLMVVNPSIEIYLLDPGGEILAYSAPPGRVQRRRVALEPILALLERRRPLPILGDDPRDAAGRKVFSASPIPLEGPTEGYLYIVLAGEQHDSAAAMLAGSYALRLSTWLAAASLVLAVGVGLLLFYRLTGRLRRLTAAVRRFPTGTEGARHGAAVAAAGEGGRPRGGTATGDEVAVLGAAFGELTRRVEAQMTELERMDHQRRELVASVSHDLRTPIAAMQGYLETLALKGDRLPAAEREEYLEIALRSCERLARLVAELFELATLDSRQGEPQREAFSLAELAHDNVQKLQLRAEEKGVRLSVDHPPDLPPVAADLGLIDRVLENLLDNALRFTPQGGSVRISLAEGGGEVEARIADTGCGISAEDLPHIFDRFYRCEPNSGGGSGGAGLGLAIAARILALHDRRIAVESTPGRGSTFSFSLPSA